MRIASAIPRPERKLREKVAVDESKLKLRGYLFFIWIARDVKTKEILAVRASYTRSSLDAYLLLKDVLMYCENKPIIVVDKGPWYKWALEELGLKYEYKRFGVRNTVERAFGIVKRRTKVFHNSFPTNSTLSSIRVFLESFTAWYNYLKAGG